jgi:hypothetical protein
VKDRGSAFGVASNSKLFSELARLVGASSAVAESALALGRFTDVGLRVGDGEMGASW